MQRITIIGLGLIGGSIGLGLRQWSQENSKSGEESIQVTGFDTDLEQQHYAQKIKAVDKTEWNLEKAVRDADLVVVAAPVRAIRETFEDIAPHLHHGAIVTDTGSTKTDVLTWANELLPRTVSFVGGHPMAGKAQSIEGAEATLFKEATWCIAPSPYASEDAIRNVLGMVAALGAEPFFIDPVEHDAFVGGVSHLPAILSAGLVNTVSSDPSWRDMKTLTAGGFRDMSRLAAGSPAMHRDIVLTNRDAVNRWIGAMITQLEDFRAMLNGDEEQASEAINSFFEKARDVRAEWATQTTREGELLQGTEMDLTKERFGDQMSRMLLGGLGGRRRKLTERSDKESSNGKSRPPR
ncbi:MAG TPA: prephenate dehydrogenase/arogenate dehydrogenase family protein [Thermomicrobiales bacterium]|nr:prephenate dehydrogenase/arogenate dehydrogenase family protein [Thermomicrobiales bacterium]